MTMTTFGSRHVWSAALSEVTTVTRSRWVPSSSQMTKVRWTPWSSRLSSAGPAPGEVRTATLVWARQTFTARRRVRRWATDDLGVVPTACPRGRRPGRRRRRRAPLRPRGRTRGRAGCVRRRRSRGRRRRGPRRCRGGRRCGGRRGPRCRGGCARRGRGSRPVPGWWAAPATIVAALSAERAAAVSGVPSQPITVTRSAIVVCLLGSRGSSVRGGGCGSDRARGQGRAYLVLLGGARRVAGPAQFQSE